MVIAETPRRGRTLAIALVLAALAAIAWANALGAPFVFDDRRMIVANPNIRQLWPPSRALFVPAYTPLSSRPVTRLTFAINHALGGLDVRGYHAVNVALHVLAAWVLLGIVRRTLARVPSFAASSGPLAFAVAAIWLVHPLQTDAVTYVSERTEVLMGLFYLLTLYAALRAWDSPRPGRWEAASIVAAALGMASKEIMVTAPVMVVLYDRVFRCRSLAEAWRRRARLYLGLGAAWGTLGVVWMLSPPQLPVLLATQQLGGEQSVGPVQAITPWQHLGAQLDAVARYLALALWPTSLCLDYGVETARSAGEVVRGAMVVATLVGGTAWALCRQPALGFLGAWLLVILAPTTSIVLIVTEVVAERRMYLPLAAVVVAVVCGAYVAVGWAMHRRSDAARATVRAGIASLVVAALTALTIDRNAVYRSPVAIWADTVEKRPSNARARNNFANELLREGRLEEAVAHYHEALRLEPDYAEAHYNLGNAFLHQGLTADAAASYLAALRVNPRLVDAHYNLGNLYLHGGRFEEAIARYTEALRIDPGFDGARHNLSLARDGLAASGRRGD